MSLCVKIYTVHKSGNTQRTVLLWHQSCGHRQHVQKKYRVWFLRYCEQTDGQTDTYTRLTALCPGLPGWADTGKVKPIWILLKQETVSGSGISWAICKSAFRSRQITMPAPHRSVFYRPDVVPAAQPTASKHWRQTDGQTYIYGEWWLIAVLCTNPRDEVKAMLDGPVSAVWPAVVN